MLEFEEALAQILQAVPPPVGESVPLSQAHGRITAEQVLSPLDLPPFDNCAVDGYAVRAEDVGSAELASPVRLRVAGRVAAGEVFSGTVERGTCVRAFTGSPLPAGADAVVMQEDTRLEADSPGEVWILDTARPLENVRLRGGDVTRGSTLAAAGEVLSVGRLALLAATGVARACVGRRPVVGVLATGSELKEPGQPLEPGQIYDSNRICLGALLERAGAISRIFPLVADTLAATQTALLEAFEQCDVVVASGGVSVGEMDFLKSAFEQAEGELQFWRVAIKPGRPFVFGRRRGKLLFGLPGNPVSALVTFLLLVRPALLRWQGAANVSPAGQSAVLGEALANPGARRHFMRVRVDAGGRVFLAGLQEAHALSSLAAADGLLDVPPRTVWSAGITVQVLGLD